MWDNDRYRVDIRNLRSQIRKQLYPLIPDSDDLEDLTQDCLIRAWINRSSFRNESKHSSWIYRLVRNEFVSWLRRRNCRAKADREWSVTGRTDHQQCAANSVINRLSVAELLPRLEKVDRRILELTYLHGKTSAEVGQELGLAASSARCRLRRLRMRCGTSS